MDALVIGAGGFVGAYLLRQLLEEGHDPGATKLPHEHLKMDGVEVFDLDLGNQSAVRNLLAEQRPAQIYHLAAQSSVSTSWKEPELTVDVNIKGTLHLLEAVRSIEDYYPRILLVGSGEEYGYLKRGESPIPETEALHPGNIYAVTKACQNMLGSVYARAYGMGIVMVRAFNHIGPGQSPLFVAADFALQIAEMEAKLRPPVMRVGNLAAKRDFSDVRDVVRAYTLLMQRGIAGETYNVGSGKAVSIQTILDILLEQSTESVAVEQDPAKMRPSDVPCIEADTAKLREDTGWEPIYSLEETLRTMLDQNRRNYGLC
jgi:GDP-4-dehydro-6-deoxy-D-mannose reductase